MLNKENFKVMSLSELKFGPHKVSNSIRTENLKPVSISTPVTKGEKAMIFLPLEVMRC